jgi:multimeric flavodoxin WrbA
MVKGGVKMKVDCLLGSPRPKGNSAAMAAKFCETAESSGAEVTVFALNKMKYRGCQACMTCKTKLEKCLLKDDLAEVLDSIRDAEVLVLATPIYFAEISSQLKAFIDRTYSYLVPDYATNPSPCRLAPGKKLVFIEAQGHPDESLFADVFPRYDSIFKWYGFSESYQIRACGVFSKGDVERRDDIMKLAQETARKIMA